MVPANFSRKIGIGYFNAYFLFDLTLSCFPGNFYFFVIFLANFRHRKENFTLFHNTYFANEKKVRQIRVENLLIINRKDSLEIIMKLTLILAGIILSIFRIIWSIHKLLCHDKVPKFSIFKVYLGVNCFQSSFSLISIAKER